MHRAGVLYHAKKNFDRESLDEFDELSTIHQKFSLQYLHNYSEFWQLVKIYLSKSAVIQFIKIFLYQTF